MRPIYTHEVQDPPSKVLVYYCSAGAFLRVLRDVIDESSISEAASDLKDSDGYFVATEEGVHFVWVSCRAKTPAEILNVLAHECLHAVTYINGHYGLDSEEYMAYLIGGIVGGAFERIEKKLKHLR